MLTKNIRMDSIKHAEVEWKSQDELQSIVDVAKAEVEATSTPKADGQLNGQLSGLLNGQPNGDGGQLSGLLNGQLNGENGQRAGRA